MPRPALPYPRNADAARVTFHRRYLDAAGRPLRGRINITRKATHVQGDTVLTASTAPVELVDGHLYARLAPGEYELAGHELRTADGVGVVHKDVVLVTADA
jgi:hypothetical protein